MAANTLEQCSFYGKWQFKQWPMCFTFSRSERCIILHTFQYSALYPHCSLLL